MSKKQRNFRKSRALQEQEGLSEDEEEREALDELRALQQLRKRKVGLTAEALLTGETLGGPAVGEDEAEEEEEDIGLATGAALAGGYVKEQVEVVEEEDPHMKKYVEEQLAKRLGKRAMSDAEALAESRAPPKDSQILVPEPLRQPEADDMEIGSTWATGITEMALPLEYKMRNIEETEVAKKRLLERRGRRGGEHDGGPDSVLHRTMVPMSFGRQQLIVTERDDTFVAERMRRERSQGKKKGGRR